MALTGMKVGIVGGSIAGCASAIALGRAGCDVTVFERSSKGLMDRGSGIAIPIPLRDRLIAGSYLPSDYANCPMSQRWWLYPDGSDTGRELWCQATPAATNNWGMLYWALRQSVADGIVREGHRLTGLEDREHGATVSFDDGTKAEFDLVVGADGYASMVRKALQPQAETDFAGYVLWRGNYPESRVDDRRLIDAMDVENTWLTVPFEGGHGVLYMIPEFDGGTEPGQRRVNWAIYAPLPKALALDGIHSNPPGQVTPDVFAALDAIMTNDFPPAFERLVRHSSLDEISIQPIYDSVVESYFGKSTLLIGGAGTITRPHTGSGATKALEDALALEKLAESVNDLPELLQSYDQERCDAARTLAGIGQRIGRAQVSETPNWSAMSPDDFEAWTKATLAGDDLYFYQTKEKELT